MGSEMCIRDRSLGVWIYGSGRRKAEERRARKQKGSRSSFRLCQEASSQVCPLANKTHLATRRTATGSIENDTCGIRTHAGRPHRLSRPTPQPLGQSVCCCQFLLISTCPFTSRLLHHQSPANAGGLRFYGRGRASRVRTPAGLVRRIGISMHIASEDRAWAHTPGQDRTGDLQRVRLTS